VGFKIDGDPQDTLSFANNMVRCEADQDYENISSGSLRSSDGC